MCKTKDQTNCIHERVFNDPSGEFHTSCLDCGQSMIEGKWHFQCENCDVFFQFVPGEFVRFCCIDCAIEHEESHRIAEFEYSNLRYTDFDYSMNY